MRGNSTSWRKSPSKRAGQFTILPPRKRKTLSRPEVLDDWMKDVGAHSETQARAAVRDGDPPSRYWS